MFIDGGAASDFDGLRSGAAFMPPTAHGRGHGHALGPGHQRLLGHVAHHRGRGRAMRGDRSEQSGLGPVGQHPHRTRDRR